LKGVHQKSIFSITSLKMKCYYNYVWGNHVGFERTSNPLVEMTFSICKHNKKKCLKKFMCLDTYTKSTEILSCLKSQSKKIIYKKLYLDSLKNDA
jgi:hypothetical protein